MAATDDYASYETPPGSCRHAVAVTPSDSADLAHVSRFLVAGVAGNVSVNTAGGESAVVIAAAAGVPLPIAATRVREHRDDGDRDRRPVVRGQPCTSEV